MDKLIFGIIGNPVSHSLSPILHNYWFKKYNISAEYKLYEVRENEIKNIIKDLKERKINGINVTLPYKNIIIPHLSRTINDAKDTHSVNTIFMDNEGSLIGENTDVYGFQAGYLQTLSGVSSNKKALIIGAGGVAPSIILALKKSNINEISLINRTYEKSLFLKKKFPSIQIARWENFEKEIRKFDIIINATSLGLKKGMDFDVKFENFKDNLIYIDTIYNPKQTKMIKFFRSKNIQTSNGLDMLIYQGQKSFYIWNKINPEVDNELINLLEKNIK
jgi:shikimate dehydrogenase|tara:strand:- start:2811 stop:3638 length:828 start_codon:yes stop_codon:yes gene_type:complete